MTKDLYEQGLMIDESKIHLRSDVKEAILQAVREIKRHRKELIDYIEKNPEFKYALKPVKASAEAPRIVEIMVESSKIAEVGPMASVAGALADLGMEAMLGEGAETAVVEDGGEIAAFTSQPITISILSSSTSLSGRFGVHVTREDCPIGIATSSSKTRRTMSFGEADSATVVAEKASTADAAATAVCNSVVGADIERSIQLGLEKARTIEGIRGAIIIRGEHVGFWGRLPRIVKIK